MSDDSNGKVGARFNPMDHRLAMEIVPTRLPFKSGWIAHIPFAYALVDMCRPNVLVELGTHSGTSYVAFCQAIAKLNLRTQCTAIDTWTGDSHAGFYEPEVLARLRHLHDGSGYHAFSTLLQSTFDNALPRFAENSIDVLHIDGLHTYEAVKHDYESWLPKVNQKTGVILFHDTRIRAGDFGVWKLWAEVTAKYRRFEFHDGPGLGVLLIGDAPPKKLAAFFDAAEHEPENVRIFFTCLSQGIKRLQAARAFIRTANQIVHDVADYRRSLGEQISEIPALEEAFANPEEFTSLTVQMVRNLIVSVASRHGNG